MSDTIHLDALGSTSRHHSGNAQIFVETYDVDNSMSRSWRDFKGDPDVLMEQYFDAFVYVTNWATRELELRLPRRLLPLAGVRPYCAGESIGIRTTDHVIVDFRSEDERGTDYAEDAGDGWVSALLPLRAEIATGDRRGLYLGWS